MDKPTTGEAVEGRPSFWLAQLAWIAAVALAVLLTNTIPFAEVVGHDDVPYVVLLFLLPSATLGFIAWPHSKSYLGPFLVLWGVLELLSGPYALLTLPVLAAVNATGIAIGAGLAKVANVRFKDRKALMLLLLSILFLLVYLWHVEFWDVSLTARPAWQHSGLRTINQGYRLTAAASSEIDASRPERAAKILATAQRLQSKQPSSGNAYDIAEQYLRLGDEKSALSALKADRDERAARRSLLDAYLGLKNFGRAIEIAEAMAPLDRIYAAQRIAEKQCEAGDPPAGHSMLVSLLPTIETLAVGDMVLAYKTVAERLAACGFDEEAKTLVSISEERDWAFRQRDRSQLTRSHRPPRSR